MRIAFITESYSVGMGYTENMLPRYLAKHGHEVRVFCSNLQIYGSQPEYKDVYEPYLGPAEQPCGELHEDGFVVERLRHFTVGRYIGIRGLKEALLRFRPDVIQATSVVSVATMEVLMARPLPPSKIAESDGSALTQSPPLASGTTGQAPEASHGCVNSTRSTGLRR